MKGQDSFQRFLFEELGIRGEWVRLQDSWQEAKQYQRLTDTVQEQLGQALAAVVLLSATIKFDGSLILQAQGTGALKTLVAQSTYDRKIRGLARCDGEVTNGLLSEMMGEGRLVITIQPKKGEPYQGIVSLEGDKLADVIIRYFLQSEQLETQVWLFANETHAAGLLLQELPAQENFKADWERISTLASTVTKDEMLNLDSEEILYRLFNEEKVKLFDAEPVVFECSCSRKKIESTLVAMGREELEGILQEVSLIDIACEFCGKKYSFDNVDVENMLSGQPLEKPSQTHH